VRDNLADLDALDQPSVETAGLGIHVDPAPHGANETHSPPWRAQAAEPVGANCGARTGGR